MQVLREKQAAAALRIQVSKLPWWVMTQLAMHQSPIANHQRIQIAVLYVFA